MIDYIIKTDNAEHDIVELAEIVFNLRRTTKFWEEHYGNSKIPKKKWEARADDWVNKKMIKVGGT